MGPKRLTKADCAGAVCGVGVTLASNSVIMFENLRIILYPDPRLRKKAKPVEKFDDNLAALAERMLQLMRENKGVGLAATQVGEMVRMFVMNATGKPEDDRVYVNPVLSDPADSDEAEEG